MFCCGKVDASKPRAISTARYLHDRQLLAMVERALVQDYAAEGLATQLITLTGYIAYMHLEPSNYRTIREWSLQLVLE